MDTNVLVAGLRSRQGASFRLLSAIGRGPLDIAVSVPLALQYEEVLLRDLPPGLTAKDVQSAIDYLCSVAHHQEIFYLWRPFLRDPNDDLVLELAVASGSSAIVTFNTRDFVGSERLGVAATTPLDFLRMIGVL